MVIALGSLYLATNIIRIVFCGTGGGVGTTHGCRRDHIWHEYAGFQLELVTSQ